ncbi:HzsA-related protein [Novipirellula artificiosorum]|uniref:Formylglycine-generating sulfatase enzyme n=1 Tax=Novipirellula artificiosorum TaxID=2528016 RepID=A0A5C6DXK9_9BACT|nr:SUMF1/EgtB/PvdO family nonheme iron enzyme [Novipirellula artificiosorum]TWU39776.1 Formylglycine-generating sulfatase enzyme [Novipirellula artificiosorum]
MERAVVDLQKNHPDQFSDAKQINNRLAQFENDAQRFEQLFLKGLRPKRADLQNVVDSFREFQRDVLLRNPLLDFAQLLVVKRDFGNSARKVIGGSLGQPTRNSHTHDTIRFDMTVGKTKLLYRTILADKQTDGQPISSRSTNQGPASVSIRTGQRLVALCPSQRTHDSLWGIYLVDVFDNITLIKEVEGSAILEPIPLQSTPRPPVILDRVLPDAKEASVFLTDIYQGPGLEGVPRGAVRNLRLFSYHYSFVKTGGHASVGVKSSWDVKRVLGTVPVEEDGSASFTIPANTPISIQPLDEQGRALQLMRSWLVGMPDLPKLASWPFDAHTARAQQQQSEQPVTQSLTVGYVCPDGEVDTSNLMYPSFPLTYNYSDQSFEGSEPIVLQLTRTPAGCFVMGSPDGPGEAQWEWACRAGTDTPMNFGQVQDDFAAHANLADRASSGSKGNPFPRISNVNDGLRFPDARGHYQTNAWGLFDMHGNVAEWTRSPYLSYGASNSEAAVDDDRRVVRGGSWRDRPHRATSSFRLPYLPYQRVLNVGFRIVVEDNHTLPDEIASQIVR